MVEAGRLSDSLQSKIVTYVINRQNEDGGYTFAQGAESNAQDTYYGLAILRQLKARFPNPEKTMNFINETRLDSIYSIYYSAKIRFLLDGRIGEELKKRLTLILRSKGYYGSSNFFSEVSSEFITTHMTLEIADLLKMKLNTKEVAEWLLGFKNEDGGFGTQGMSNINSTYYTVASLSLLKECLREPHETLRFLRDCEKPYGGFTVVPINFTPYMEHTYFGVMTLDLLDEKCRYPSQTIDWILQCQNKNGGFARSDLGISTFLDTFSAIAILQKLGNSQV